ncbi:MAG: UDP-N-acetylglucosamine 2-epimerase (non-hydrolyzing) [Bauldia sp.]|nr:UDP-N-acetylglucosamine 2-epimerase (non-hydrolyzing) [Bauldia sp.]
MRVLSVVGARPNFMKAAPLVRLLHARPNEFPHLLVHTGQHYDARMSESFFDDLKIPAPDVNLEVGSGSHAETTGRVMIAIEPVMAEFRPDLVVVFGDVNSTMAAAITAKKLNVAVAHVEAGLRSLDRSMPEEINRLCTDAIADLLFTTDRIAGENLLREGHPADHIHFVGNLMIDTLVAFRDAAAAMRMTDRLGLVPGGFATLTLHRPSNVDDADTLRGILEAIAELGAEMPILFPVHPRTRKRIADFGLDRFLGGEGRENGIRPVEPLGYLEFLSLNMSARLALTDSGGIQEETTVLGVPCVTLRKNTERPITVLEGTNRLVGSSPKRIRAGIAEALAGASTPRRPELWDGHAAERVMAVLERDR